MTKTWKKVERAIAARLNGKRQGAVGRTGADKMTKKIFAIPITLQADAIKKHCLGDCGKGLLALVDDTDWGAMQMCKQTECPFLHSEMDEPFGQIDEYLVYLRRILDEDK